MKTLILWLDAIRADYLAHMPFVNGNEWGIFASNRVVLPADASMEDVLSRMLSAMGLSALSDSGNHSETEP